MLKNFRTYQLALDLHRQVDALTVAEPIRSQMRRACLSVVLNLAEGCGKLTGNDRKRFFSIALGSLRETQACLDILDDPKLIDLADKIGAHIYKLIARPGYLKPENRKQKSESGSETEISSF